MSDSFTTPDMMDKKIAKAVDPVNKFLWAVTGVLLVGFIAMLVTVAAMVMDVFQSRTDATNELKQSVDYLNQTIRAQYPKEVIISNPAE